MLFRTHIAFGFLVGLILVDILKISNNVLFLILLMFFTALPDIDEYNSKISQKLRPLAFVVRLLTRHRGIFHSIFIPFILSLILFLMNRKFLALAVLFGYLSHLVIDAITVMGIMPLYPLLRKKFRGFIRVGSLLENIVFAVILILIWFRLI